MQRVSSQARRFDTNASPILLKFHCAFNERRLTSPAKLYLVVLEAGTVAGAGQDLALLLRIVDLRLRSSVQMLKVRRLRSSRVIVIVCHIMVAVLPRLSLHLRPSRLRGVVLVAVFVVDFAICLFIAMLAVLMDAVAVAAFVKVAAVTAVRVETCVTRGFIMVQGALLTLGSGTVFPYLIDQKYFGHVI